MKVPQRVVIVGGGISGLAAAYYLCRQARAAGVALQVHLLEAGDRWGGVIHTVREAGFIVEGGPDSILSYKPAGMALWRDLGLEAEIVGTSPRHRGSFIYSRGALHPLPEGLTLMIPARLGPLFRTRLLSWRGKLRAGLDLLRRRAAVDGDVSLADFVTAHLGSEVFERIVEPLFAGIYAGDARQLSLAATYPQLLAVAQEHGSLLRGLLMHRRARPSTGGASGRSRWTPFVTLRQGLGQMVDALLHRLEGVDLRLQARVTRVVPAAGNGWQVHLANGDTLPADAVVIATPAHVAAALLADVDPTLADALAAIPYASTVTVSLAYRREDVPHPLNGYGFVVPRVEGRPLLACTWTSSKFPHRAPAGFALFRCFLGRAGEDAVIDWPEEAIVAQVREELRAIMGLTAAPVRVWVFRWPRALPQYTVGHLERLRRIEARLADLPGLFLLGNAYRGVGVPDCVAAAQRLAADLFSAK